LVFYRSNEIDAAAGRVSKNGNATVFVNAVDELLHVRSSNTFRDAVSKDVNRAALKSEFKTRNHDALWAGERIAKSRIFLHSFVVEYLRMIADEHEIHAGGAQRLNDAFERFFSVGESTMNV